MVVVVVDGDGAAAAAVGEGSPGCLDCCCGSRRWARAGCLASSWLLRRNSPHHSLPLFFPPPSLHHHSVQTTTRTRTRMAPSSNAPREEEMAQGHETQARSPQQLLPDADNLLRAPGVSTAETPSSDHCSRLPTPVDTPHQAAQGHNQASTPSIHTGSGKDSLPNQWPKTVPPHAPRKYDRGKAPARYYCEARPPQPPSPPPS